MFNFWGGKGDEKLQDLSCVLGDCSSSHHHGSVEIGPSKPKLTQMTAWNMYLQLQIMEMLAIYRKFQGCFCEVLVLLI